jgi:hypothetical protein
VAYRPKTNPRISPPRRGPSWERDPGVVGQLHHLYARVDRPARRQNPSHCAQANHLALSRGPSALPQRAPPSVHITVIGAQSGSMFKLSKDILSNN